MHITFSQLAIGATFRLAASPAVYRKASEYHAMLVEAHGDNLAYSRTGMDGHKPVQPTTGEGGRTHKERL